MAHSSPEVVVVSGIPAGDSGTGRLVAHLKLRMVELAGGRIKLVARPERPPRWQLSIWWRNKEYSRAAKEVLRYALRLYRFWLGLGLVWINPEKHLILLHPQNLGYRLAIKLIESRTNPTLMFLLDSSFFCIVSYNHIQGENGSCTRCLEDGFGQIKLNGCKPFPRVDWTALEFAPQLQVLAKEGRVNVVAQNQRQAELAQRQFGLASPPQVIGLWTQDWDEVFVEKPWLRSATDQAYKWDVLFHGHCLDAKGAGWIARIAAICSELKFLLPFPKPDWFEASANCSFVPCTWENGLQDEIKKARFVIVPSLWSAPIEGALVKSIACANAVAVVNNPNSYSDELPGEIVLKLMADPMMGAQELRRAMVTGWMPDVELKRQWLEGFVQYKNQFAADLFDAATAYSGQSSD